MDLSDEKFRARARAVANRRKMFRYGLVVVVLLGGVLGYYLSGIAAGFITKLPEGHPGFPIDTWAAWREIILATFSAFGMIITPALLGGVYFLLGRRESERARLERWELEEHLRQKRDAETERRIEQARAAGALNRWDKS